MTNKAPHPVQMGALFLALGWGPYPSRVVISRREDAMMAMSPMAPNRLCHHLLRRSPMREALLAMMTIRTPSIGAMSTVRDWAMTIRPTGEDWNDKSDEQPEGQDDAGENAGGR